MNIKIFSVLSFILFALNAEALRIWRYNADDMSRQYSKLVNKNADKTDNEVIESVNEVMESDNEVMESDNEVMESDNEPINNENQSSNDEELDIKRNFDQCQIDYQQACLAAHNKYRAMHRAPLLKSSLKLHQSAFDYAKKLAALRTMRHSNLPVGENLAMSWSSRVKSLSNCAAYAEKYVKMWYDEVALYNFNNPGFSSQTGHFTQVVWVSTSELGCGVAMSNDYQIYAVSHYLKPGNFNNEFRTNVLPKV